MRLKNLYYQITKEIVDNMQIGEEGLIDDSYWI